MERKRFRPMAAGNTRGVGSAALHFFCVFVASCASSQPEKVGNSARTQPPKCEDAPVLPKAKAELRPDPDGESVVPADGAAGLSRSGSAAVRERDYGIPYLENASNLSNYFGALERLEAGNDEIVRVAHFGDSHSAADISTTEIRRSLQDRFGDGGRGFVLLGRPWKYYRPKDIRLGQSGHWRPRRFIISVPSDELDGRYGFGGVSVECRSPQCQVTVRPSTGRYGTEFDFFELYYLRQPGGGKFALQVEKEPVTKIDTAASSFTTGFYSQQLAGDFGRRIELRTLGGGPVRLFGAVVEKAGPGVVYDTLGINGATFDTVLQWDRQLFLEQLERRNPNLIVAMYGTNETCSKTLTAKTYAFDVWEAMQLLREGTPRADCLLIGPPDRQGELEELERLDWVVRVQQEVAEEMGCAFLDARALMGGPGSHARWQAAGLAARDGIHLTLRGYEQLGQRIAQIYLEAYEAHRELSEPEPKKETSRAATPSATEFATPRKSTRAGGSDGTT